MRWPFRNKTEQEMTLDFAGRELLAVVGRAISFSVALFAVLSVVFQFYVPGLLTDRLSPSALAVVALVGLLLGSLGDLGKDRGFVHFFVTAVLVTAAAWAAWLYLGFLPYGRSGYTMLAAVGLFLLSWRRPGLDNKK